MTTRPPRLIGERVVLRPFADDDISVLFALFSDPVAMRYWAYPPFTERSQAQDKLARDRRAATRGEALPWGIALRETDALIGTCTLFSLDQGNGRAEIGYLLGRAHWGKGLAQEAVRLAIDYAFGPLEMRRLEADIDPRNAASQRLLERLGFQKEGLLRERWHVAGEISDSALFGLLAREWRERR